MKVGDLVKLPSVHEHAVAAQGLKFWWSGQIGVVIEKDVKGRPGTAGERLERDECRVLIGDRWCWFSEEGLELIK